jgi:hypothetical protein
MRLGLPIVMLAASPRYLDKAKLKSLNLTPAARDAFGISGDPQVRHCSMPQFREAPHVQFNFALIYSASRIEMGRSFSGVTS